MFKLMVMININVENHVYWQKFFKHFVTLTERIYFLGALLGLGGDPTSAQVREPRPCISKSKSKSEDTPS